jgi:hypothetical protein
MLTDQEAVERIKAIRHPVEPEAAPTTEDSIDLSSQDEPEEAPIEEDIDFQEVADAEESEDQASETQEFEDDLFYVDLDGEEITSKQIKEWKSGHMMQSDYTRKTQELSDERKNLDEEREKISAEMAKLQEKVTVLTALADTGKLSSEEIQEMREYEPEKYIEYMERQNNIDAAIKDAKSVVKEKPDVDYQAESQKLFSNNPQWLDNGKPTKAFEEDKKLMSDYALSVGYSNEELANIGNAHHYQTLLDAARYKVMSNKNASIEKKVRRAPVTTRPRSNASATGEQADYDKALKAFKSSPTDRNAVELRKAKRKLNN